MGRAGWQRRKTALLVAAAVLAAGAGVAAYATNLLRRTELQTIDARFSIRGPHKPPANIVLVAIDNATLQAFARQERPFNFPFPRRYDAKVIDRLREAGAKVISLDLQFTQPTDETDDNDLIEAIGRAHGKVVLATTEVGKGGSTGILGGSTALLHEIGARPANAVFALDTDGSVRRLPFALEDLKSLAVVTEEVATGRVIHASRFSGGTLPIDFAGPPGSFPTYSYFNVLEGTFPPGAFRGKTVILGATASVLQDVHATATTGASEMSGSEVWANAVATLSAGAPLTDAPGWLNLLLIVMLGSFIPLGSLRLAPLRALLDGLAAAVVFTLAVQIAFDKGWILSFVYPLFALILATLGTLAVVYLSETVERERVYNLFSRFVSEDVVNEVVARAGENLRLGAVELDCTVLFSDLRGFTSFSEQLPAARVIDVVNCYLNEMTEAILEAGGTIVSYMGDGIMAVFGAPLEQANHADRALLAASEMIGPRLERFNAWIAEQGHDHEFAMGVGINSGPVMAGSIGSEQRVEYTALGDTTNTASRLEGMTKGSGHMLFIAESTRQRMRHPPDDLIHVGDLEVRGRVHKLTVWSIPGRAQSSSPFGDSVPPGGTDGKLSADQPLGGSTGSALSGGT
jgi:adenylate cyclase